MVIASISAHYFPLGSIQPQLNSKGGARSDAKASNFPILDGMALSLLVLEANGYREPHWHPNANELSYCLEGKCLFTVFTPSHGHETFVIEAGDLAFAPMGSIHFIKNIGGSQAKFLVCFDNENAEDLDLSNSFSAMSDYVLGATFNKDPAYISKFQKRVEPLFAGVDDSKPLLLDAYETNPYKMKIESSLAQLVSAGGWVKKSNSYLFPKLEGLAIYSLNLEKKGVREPHWHPNAHELNYLISGSAKITIVSPGKQVDTFDLRAGDISFLPKGYLHHIENTGDQPARFAVFFNNTDPGDIGLSGAVGAFSNETLASLFGVSLEYLHSFPKYQEDLLIVAGGG